MSGQEARDVIDAAAAIIMADTKGTNDPLVWEQADELERESYRSNVRALLAAGFAIVKLPEPHPREDIGEVTTRWEDALPHTVDVWDDNRDQVQLSYNFEPSEPLTPSESRYLGSALLAAAAYAEAGERDE